MEKINITFNILAFSVLFVIFFIKVTDKKKRKKVFHFTYCLGMLFTLFVSVFLIKNFDFVAFYENKKLLNMIATITNVLFITYLAREIYVGECDIQSN